MKRNLFLTTALITLFFVTDIAVAENITERQIIESGNERTFSQATANGIESPWMSGGVIKNSGIVNINKSDFTDNSAHYGGVIYNSKTLNIGDSSFENNHADASGGAIHNSSYGTVTITGNTTFKGNTHSPNAGGSIPNDIFNAGVLNLIPDEGETILFESGIDGDGGNDHGTMNVNGKGTVHVENELIYHDVNLNSGTLELAPNTSAKATRIEIAEGAKLSAKKTTFENSSDDKGGAIYNSGKADLIESLFTKNKSEYGFAGAVYNKGTITISDSVFENNIADREGLISEGGAIKNEGGTAIISNSTFTGNKAIVQNSSSSGGAIYNENNSILKITDSAFNKNEASGNVGSGGGAVLNGSYCAMSVVNTTFADNKSVTGGAIHNSGDLTLNDVSFIKNAASYDDAPEYGNGGAIKNYMGAIEVTNGSFVNNMASADGGAIYNDAGTMNFRGKVVFEDNKAGGNLNDIYNMGTINVFGNLTLDGGMQGYSSLSKGKLNFQKGSNLTVNGGVTSIVNHDVKNEGATLHMQFDNAYSGQYVLISDGSVLDNEFTIADNALYNINTTETKGTYDISKRTGAEIAQKTGASPNAAAAVSAITNGKGSNMLFNDMADKINDLMQSGDAGAKMALEASETLAPETAPLLQQTQTAVIDKVFGAVGSRFVGGMSNSVVKGKSGGDVLEGGAMWAQSMMNHAKLDGSSYNHGFKSDTYGLALGFEKKFSDDVMAGIGYAYNNTDVNAKMRDTDIDTHTALLYAEYKPNKWFVNGISSYSWSNYEEKKAVLGTPIKAKYDVESFGLQLMTGYDLPTEYVTIIPEFGMRYLHTKQDKYTDSIGQIISENNSDLLTGVIGAKVNKAFDVQGIKLTPEAKLLMTYDMKHDDVSGNVNLPNGSSYIVNGKALERFGIETGAQLGMSIDSMDFSLRYEGKFKKDYQDHTGMVNFKYNF